MRKCRGSAALQLTCRLWQAQYSRGRSGATAAKPNMVSAAPRVTLSDVICTGSVDIAAITRSAALRGSDAQLLLMCHHRLITSKASLSCNGASSFVSSFLSDCTNTPDTLVDSRYGPNPVTRIMGLPFLMDITSWRTPPAHQLMMGRRWRPVRST